MSIGKNGVWKGKEFSNYSYRSIISPQVIQEPDGSMWLQIYRLNNPTTNGYFKNTDTFINGVYLDENRWFNINACNAFSKWELLVKQKATETIATESKYRWIQSVNPMIATHAEVATDKITYITTSGYSTHTYGGMYKKNSACYLSQHVPNQPGWWWGGIGPWQLNGSSIPAWAGVSVTTGYTEVYIRIDNDSLSPTDKAKIFNNQDTIGLEFIEI